nr:response regulator transcription factor [Streptomyces sp. WI04-05B]
MDARRVCRRITRITDRRRGHAVGNPSGDSISSRTKPSPAPERVFPLLIRLVTADTRLTTLKDQLTEYGSTVEIARSGEAALRDLARADLLLLDLDIADRDGLDVCREIRELSDLPILCFTSRTQELDRVLAFQAGTDDCLVRPFGLHELRARIEAITRRLQGASTSQPSRVMEHGPLRIVAESREVWMRDRLVPLTRKEFDLLFLLASRPQGVMSRRQLLDAVWRDTWSGPGRTLDSHVSSIRRKLGSPDWITAVRGAGFMFGREIRP